MQPAALLGLLSAEEAPSSPHPQSTAPHPAPKLLHPCTAQNSKEEQPRAKQLSLRCGVHGLSHVQKTEAQTEPVTPKL